jgi:hypothetical protein
MKIECKNESWRRKKITQKVKEMSWQKFTTSQQINMNIDDHHHHASHNKQQKHHSSVHYLLLLSDTIFCSLSASTIEYHLQKKTSNQANLDSHHNCHHENSSLVNLHALMKESIEIMITLCMKRQSKYNETIK